MSTYELSVELHRAGFAIPRISIELWQAKTRRKVEGWLAYQKREKRSAGRAYRRPRVLDFYKVCISR